MQEEKSLQASEAGSPPRARGDEQAGALSTGDFGARAGEGVAATTQNVASFVDRLAQVARAEACIGEPQSAGGHTLVPLATVSVQAGFGFGFGGGGGNDASGQTGGGSGAGAGGGGRGASRVVAVADISESGVEVRPVADVTTIALGVLALIALGMVLRRGSGAGGLRGRLLGFLNRGE